MNNFFLRYFVCCLAFAALAACGTAKNKLPEEIPSHVENEIELDGFLMDSRNGHIYRTVKIGDQTWLAENLNYNVKGSECLGGNDSNCVKYGRLYSWNEATNCFDGHCNLTFPVQGACPVGWHLPTIEEWKTLLSVTRGNSVSGPLKSRVGWKDFVCDFDDYCVLAEVGGTDDYGFAVLPSNGGFYDLSADFWSSSDIFSSQSAYPMPSAYSLHIDDSVRINESLMHQSFSIRCVKDRRESNVIIPDPVPGSDSILMDPRDGQTYRTVRIGSQTWMAENLNYKTDSSYCWWGWSDSVAVEYGNSPCIKYGRIYLWNEAKDVCPTGWLLPTPEEWYDLFSAVGGLQAASRALKFTSGWRDGQNGTDDYGFSVMATGYYGDVEFWTSAELDSGRAYKVDFTRDVVNVVPGNSWGSSVRCVKDRRENKETPWILSPGSEARVEGINGYADTINSRKTDSIVSSVISAPAYSVIPALVPGSDSSSHVSLSPITLSFWRGDAPIGSMTDSRDGKTYKTVAIGTQTWMAENLNFELADSYCYANDSNKCAKYGRLYKGNVAMEICPVGWHLPTLREWEQLFSAVGGQFTASNKLKSSIGWNDDKNGSDDYGFSAYPAGLWKSGESFINEGLQACFWSYTVVGDKLVHFVKFNVYDGNVLVGGFNPKNAKDGALSVRCVRDEFSRN